MLQEARVGPPASDIIRRINVQKLNGVGLSVPDNAVKRASEVLSRLTLADRKRVAGLYVIRDHNAMWFLSDRPRYFSCSD